MRIQKMCMVIALAVIGVGFAGCHSVSSQPDVEEIIARVKQKNDPCNRAETVNTAILKYDCVNDGEKSRIKIFLKTPGKIKIIFQSENELWECAYDGKTAWEYNNTSGVRTLSGAPANEVRLQAFLLAPSIKIEEVFKEIKIAGSEKVAGEDCWKLACQPADTFDSQPIIVFVNKKTSLIVKSIEKQDTCDGVVEVISNFGDYRAFNDFLLPVKTITQVEGDSTESILSGVMMNLDIPDSEFALPQDFK